MQKTFMAAFAGVLACAGSVHAQEWPTRPMTLIVPFAAGGGVDVSARIQAQRMGEMLGQTIVVENVGAAAGMVGGQRVMNAPPDGYTFLVGNSGTHAYSQGLNKKPLYNSVTDFQPVGLVTESPRILVARKGMPANNLQEFVAYVKARPKQLNFASSGLASTAFIGAELFRQTAKLEMTHVPYRGSPEAQTAVIRNDAQMFFTFSNVGSDLIQSGKIRALAVATPKRLPTLPDVPTFAEAGMPEFTYDAWFGLLAPAGTPSAIVNKINADVAAVIALPDVQQRLAQQGVIFAPNTAEAFNAAVTSDAARYKDLFAQAGLPN